MRDKKGHFIKGHAVPQEWKSKSRERLLGNSLHNIPHSEETKRKISESKKGTIPWNKGKSGVQTVSDETKKKLSKTSSIAWKNMDSTKKIFVIVK